MNDASQVYDAAVVGGGPAGLTAAIALAAAGAKTALLARRVPYADNRTTALLGASVDLFERLDVWPRCHDNAAALRVMRLVDDTGRLIRAPEVRFSSDEIGLDPFGYNIDNRSLMAALERAAGVEPHADLTMRRRRSTRTMLSSPSIPARARGRRSAGYRRRRAAVAVPQGCRTSASDVATSIRPH